MSRDNQVTYERLAKVAAVFLVLFATFCIGFSIAQLDIIQSIQNYVVSGESKAELLPYARAPLDKNLTIWSTQDHALGGGAVLIGPGFSDDLAMLLVNEQGHVLHRWHAENRIFNPEVEKWWGHIPLEDGFEIDDAHLLPGGDVIFIQDAMGVYSYRGQRLARMDSDSHVIWEVPGNFHHFIDIAGNPQQIYVLSSRLKEGFPEVAASEPETRYLEDYVEMYSLEGKKLNEVSIVDAFIHSPYHNWITSFEISLPIAQRILLSDGRTLYDLLHSNSVQYLDAQKAKALPFAKEGDLLLSFRALDAIAVLRPGTKEIVWACAGPWTHQHDAQVGDDGKLYLYDNEGRQAVSPHGQEGKPEQLLSRVISFNPFNNQMDEIYASHEMHSSYMGNYQPLEGGGWIISSPKRGRVIAVSAEKKIIWQMRTVPDPSIYFIPHRKQISFMHYYPASSLPVFPAEKSAKPQP